MIEWGFRKLTGPRKKEIASDAPQREKSVPMILDHTGREAKTRAPASRRNVVLTPARLDKIRSEFQTELATIRKENAQQARAIE